MMRTDLHCDLGMPLKKTSSAGAEISDGPHKGGLRRDGPNDFMFVNNLIQKDLSIFNTFCFYLFVLLVMFSIFCNLSTIHNLATYAYYIEQSTIHNFTFRVVLDQFVLMSSFFNLYCMLMRAH